MVSFGPTSGLLAAGGTCAVWGEELHSVQVGTAVALVTVHGSVVPEATWLTVDSDPRLTRDTCVPILAEDWA